MVFMHQQLRGSILRFYTWLGVFLVLLSVARCPAQGPEKDTQEEDNKKLNVSWIYGSYVPKEVPLEPLSGKERFRLYLRQTFTTPGIYIKTALFAAHDQVADSPVEWGGADGYAKRFLSRHGQFLVQNSISSAGNAAVGWEPRYDRCRCDGLWPRTRHAVVRNFVTYDKTEKNLRPQLMQYAAAFGAGAIATTWQPGNPVWTVRGSQSAITQIGVGMGVNWVSEFAPEIFRPFRKSKSKNNSP
jgi:hypothetical protein